MRRGGCKLCLNRTRYDLDSFITAANLKHNNKYDYSSTTYENKESYIEVICKEHGQFSIKASLHLDGKGCNKCSNSKDKLYRTYQEFISEANNIHENKYEYILENISLLDRARISDKVKIYCKEHNCYFEQKVENHLWGRTMCSKCMSKGYSRKEVEWLDSLGIPNTEECRQVRIYIGDYKYFIVDGFDSITNTIYEFNGDYWHGNPLMYNFNEINLSNRKTFGELYEATIGKEELIKSAGYNLISIWEEEFDKLKIN